jgi:ABC-type Na+ transport system ATPase subunit NatA
VRISSPGQAVAAGIGLLPEDRKQQGVLLNLPIRTNALMTPLNPYLRALGLISDRVERIATEDMRRDLRLKAASIEAEVGTLSGGNQQKVALMKWLVSRCDVLLLDEPTRGVDDRHVRPRADHAGRARCGRGHGENHDRRKHHRIGHGAGKCPLIRQIRGFWPCLSNTTSG